MAEARGTYYTILGLLDKGTRLVADSHAFILQFKKKVGKDQIWASTYYYSALGDAIRGYAKHAARKKGRKVPNTKPLLDLIDLVTVLEKTVKDVGESLSTKWASIMDDPIERAIFEEEVNA